MVDQERVIIAGGGPVGMVCALALLREGIPCLVLEADDTPGEDQRAASYHPPTLEILNRLGLARAMIAEGLISPVYHFSDRISGELLASFDLGLLKDELRFPYVLQFEQYKLVEKIAELHGHEIDVRFSAQLVDFVQTGDHVDVVVQNADGEHETLRGSYLIGCDGGRSEVRKQAGIDFEGFTYPELFIKIGTTFDFAAHNCGFVYRNYFSDPDEWCNLFKVRGKGPPGIWRGVFPMRVGETEEEAMEPEALEARLQRFFPKPGRYEIAYRNVYVVSQCVAATFNLGRVLLAGDSCHVNNPIGGMGLNGGIHDAANLCQKLALVWRGEAEASVLDLYTRQRRTAAVDFTQAQTIHNKKILEEKDPVVRKRNHDDMRRIGEDEGRARAYMRRAQLMDSLNSAAAVV
jgi:3-(3-hydroxy-phenyl)propionate hydroxylase